MNSSIITDFDNFDFGDLALAQPHAVQGGTYFTRLTRGGENLYIQTPKCRTKQGVTRTEHKVYTDLLFSREDDGFVRWLEGLESRLQALVYDKRTMWFHNDLELDDIESAFTPVARVYRSGRNYLVRCSLGKSNGTGLKQDIKVFNESEKDVRLDDIEPTNSVVTILEISGIRFSSRSFHVDLHVKQMMVFQDSSPFSSCMIRAPAGGASTDVPGEDEASLSHSDDDGSVEDGRGAEAPERGDESGPVEETVPANESGPAEKTVPVEADTAPGKANEGTGPAASGAVAGVKDDLGDSSSGAADHLEKVRGDGEAQCPLEEVELTFDVADDEIRLKDPNEVYMQIYMAARQKAKLARKAAVEAYLEAKSIRNTYLLEELDDSDEEDMPDFSES